jgi:hypothetical protein
VIVVEIGLHRQTAPQGVDSKIREVVESWMMKMMAQLALLKKVNQYK